MSLLHWFAISAIGSTIGSNSCDPFSNNVVNIGKDENIKHIKLLKFDASRFQPHKPQLFFSSEKNYSNGIIPFNLSPGAVDVGMSTVPVLDQGTEGTCVTFSTTAALDVLIDQGDFISQQCSLALDGNLGNNYWNGADYPSQILQPLQTYGVVNKVNCPSAYPDISEFINIPSYQILSDRNASNIVAAAQFEYSPTANLQNIKIALTAGKRVLLAISIDATSQEAVQGFNINVGGFEHQGGLWACKQPGSPNYCKNSLSGHEILVIGYDDRQQLLKIRNSWGKNFGDNGNFYMTYAFFNSMAVDMTLIY